MASRPSPQMAENRPLSNVPYEYVNPDDVLDNVHPDRDLPDIPMSQLPPGAAAPRPRFMGAALADEGPRPVSSYSSLRDNSPTPRASEYYGDSVYGLNGEALDADRYRDDPFSPPGEDYATPVSAAFAGEAASKAKTSTFFPTKRDFYASPRTRSRRRALLFGGLAAGAIVVIIVAVGVYFGAVKPHQNQSKSGSGSDNGNGDGGSNSPGGGKNTTSVKVAITGGNGSVVTMADGTNFTYINNFGGYWYSDPDDPFSNNARAQSWSPGLNETFRYGIDSIRGVNLGGWLTTEPFISPALYEKYENNTPNSIDEWTLSINMRADTGPGGGIQQLEQHYQTFITEQDFAEIAAAGLNFVRIPLPYWAIEVRADEPFLEGVCWQYFLKAIEWARKYGLRINLDFHALPGSQNGWNHSGRLGTYNVLYGPMGYANAQRALDYIRIIAEFISQPEYSSVVPIFGITNEPQGSDVGQPVLETYYYAAYETVRNVSGLGEGNGPYVSIHDGFVGQQRWADFMTGADRMVLDTHPYIAFSAQSAAPRSSFTNTPCDAWGAIVNNSIQNFGLSTSGEWSNAVNDCGLWVNGVKQGVRFEGTFPGFSTFLGSCEPYNDWQNYTQEYKEEIKQWALNSMDALQEYFFWTWKIGNSSVTGTVEAPMWSYQLGLQNGWMPEDPREATGACNYSDVRPLTMSAWMTGGPGAGTFAPAATEDILWPPASMVSGGDVATMISYTATGSLPTLSAPSYTLSNGSVAGGTGWYNAQDTMGLSVNISGCSYPDPWYGDDATTPDIPEPWCDVAAPEKRVAAAPSRAKPLPTPKPTQRS